MRLQTVVLICLAVGATLACQHSEDRYLTRNVITAEPAGTWVATPAAIDGLRYASHARHLSTADHELVIRSDRTCSYRGFADVVRTKGADEGYLHTSCTWRLGNVGHQALLLHLNTTSTDVHFYFSEGNAGLLLWQYTGDPDAWKYVELGKQSNDQPAKL